eukprot:CAMPEP_0198252396 /NCGR_PEP_ID=MMETSP1447-20131203/2908_1 /TAXON_ID=420782 /ORGANISM="Chaetoceros dichaeta, Strain CCMP1751" /LENGTH=271 /DNA_ID=CAMNT_0043937643 /DNA_START=68 /DNA_END=883 /DNA_ORIENTATION=+
MAEEEPDIVVASAATYQTQGPTIPGQTTQGGPIVPGMAALALDKKSKTSKDSKKKKDKKSKTSKDSKKSKTSKDSKKKKNDKSSKKKKGKSKSRGGADSDSDSSSSSGSSSDDDESGVVLSNVPEFGMTAICLDINGHGPFTEGLFVSLYEVRSGAPSQVWQFHNDGTIRLANTPHMVLSVNCGNVKGKGPFYQAQDCILLHALSPPADSQVWKQKDDGTICLAANKSLRLTSLVPDSTGNSSFGNHVRIGLWSVGLYVSKAQTWNADEAD